MKLYEVPRNTRIVTSSGWELNFHHVDGMYSHCTDDEGNVFHLVASTEVEVISVVDEAKDAQGQEASE